MFVLLIKSNLQFSFICLCYRNQSSNNNNTNNKHMSAMPHSHTHTHRQTILEACPTTTECVGCLGAYLMDALQLVASDCTFSMRIWGRNYFKIRIYWQMFFWAPKLRLLRDELPFRVIAGDKKMIQATLTMTTGPCAYQ